MRRVGLGRGMGKGYKNLVPLDAHIHSLSAKGIQTKYLIMDLSSIEGIEKAEKQKESLENQGYSYKKMEQIGLDKWKSTYELGAKKKDRKAKASDWKTCFFCGARFLTFEKDRDVCYACEPEDMDKRLDAKSKLIKVELKSGRTVYVDEDDLRNEKFWMFGYSSKKSDTGWYFNKNDIEKV